MNATPNRRAVLGAALAAGATLGTIPGADALAATNELSESGRQAVEQWIRLRALHALQEDLAVQVKAADERLPAWARIGPKWLCGLGVDEESQFSDLPAITAPPPVEPRETRKEARAAERTRVGLVELEAEHDRVSDEISDLISEILSSRRRIGRRVAPSARASHSVIGASKEVNQGAEPGVNLPRGEHRP